VTPTADIAAWAARTGFADLPPRVVAEAVVRLVERLETLDAAGVREVVAAACSR